MMAPAPEKDDSVFDFLYIDSRRISLFLSQFDQYGHLTSLTRSVAESSKTAGGVDLKLAKMEYNDGAETGLHKNYDAQWVAPLSFLDQAISRKMIKRGLGDTRIGELILASGTLEVRDLAIVRRVFAMPAMQASVRAGASDQRSRNERRKNDRRGREVPSPTPPNPTEFGFQLLAELPHALHATVNVGADRIWCSLREESLLVSPSDLFLKHGVHISGTWSILGILDGIPDHDEEVSQESAQAEFQHAQSAMPQGEIEGIVTIATQGFGGLIDGLAPMVRLLLGRPSRAYGITPLLIFREVGA